MKHNIVILNGSTGLQRATRTWPLRRSRSSSTSRCVKVLVLELLSETVGVVGIGTLLVLLELLLLLLGVLLGVGVLLLLLWEAVLGLRVAVGLLIGGTCVGGVVGVVFAWGAHDEEWV